MGFTIESLNPQEHSCVVDALLNLTAKGMEIEIKDFGKSVLHYENCLQCLDFSNGISSEFFNGVKWRVTLQRAKINLSHPKNLCASQLYWYSIFADWKVA